MTKTKTENIKKVGQMVEIETTMTEVIVLQKSVADLEAEKVNLQVELSKWQERADALNAQILEAQSRIDQAKAMGL